MSEMLDDRLPPQNIEAEQAVLGAVFLEPTSFITASEVLMPEDFYRVAHQKVYASMQALNNRGEAIDLVTVTEELNATKQLEDVGGVSYLSELAAFVPTAANIEYYIKIVGNLSFSEEKEIHENILKEIKMYTDGLNYFDEFEKISIFLIR